MSMFKGFWRLEGPSWGMYIMKLRPSELETTDHKLYLLIMKYGEMFDDEWYYWLGKNGRWIRRIPIELAQDSANAKEHHWFEKPKRYEPNAKIVDF